MNVNKKFNDIINDMREDDLNIRKRGVSLEENSVRLLYECLLTFRNVLNTSNNISNFNEDKHDVIKRMELVYAFMEQKFDTIESMLKEANIEYWERVAQEIKDEETQKFKEHLIVT